MKVVSVRSRGRRTVTKNFTLSTAIMSMNPCGRPTPPWSRFTSEALEGKLSAFFTSDEESLDSLKYPTLLGEKDAFSTCPWTVIVVGDVWR
jgi:hypothetical protein